MYQYLANTMMLLSIICFASGAAYAIYRRKSLNPLLFGTAVAVFLIFISYRLSNDLVDSAMIPASLFNTFRVFLFNEDLTFVLEGTSEYRLHLYISSMYVVAPVLLIGSIITYILEMSTRAKLLIMRLRAKEIYIFSELNEKSLLLAEDLAHKQERVCSVFAGKPEIIQGELFDLVERSKRCRAILQKSSITELRWLKRMSSKQVSWVLISDDQLLNLQQAIAINEQYKSTHNGTVYVFSEQPEAEMLLDTMAKDKLKIRRVNDRQSAVFNLFSEQPLYQNCENKKIHILIAGASEIGLECLRTAAWCGQMDGFSLKITCADNDSAAFDKLRLNCPELLESCDIVLRHADLDSPQLCDLIRDYLSVTYVIVARNSDDSSSQTAINIRSAYERFNFGGHMPMINVYINSPEQAGLISDLTNGQGQSYNLQPFGSNLSIYKTEIVFHSKWEQLALEMHQWLGYDAADFDAMEYNRKASIAAVVHMQYKLRSAGVASSQDYARYIENPSNLDRQARAEHERWNAYMRSVGYISADLQEAERYLKSINNHKNVMALKHSCLIGFDELDQLTKLVKPYKNIDFKEQDIRSVKWLASRQG